MDDNLQKAFEFAQDLVKQLITLSTAVIALTVTFNKDFADPNASQLARSCIGTAFVFFIFSIASGIWTLMALTGSLVQTVPSIYGKNVTVPALVQIGFFVVGLVLTVVAGWWMI